MPTTIDLRLFASLAAHTPINAADYPIESGMTISELLNEVEIPLQSAKIVFVNGVLCEPDTRLFGGERVGIFPPIGGG